MNKQKKILLSLNLFFISQYILLFWPTVQIETTYSGSIKDEGTDQIVREDSQLHLMGELPEHETMVHQLVTYNHAQNELPTDVVAEVNFLTRKIHFPHQEEPVHYIKQGDYYESKESSLPLNQTFVTHLINEAKQQQQINRKRFGMFGVFICLLINLFIGLGTEMYFNAESVSRYEVSLYFKGVEPSNHYIRSTRFRGIVLIGLGTVVFLIFFLNL